MTAQICNLHTDRAAALRTAVALLNLPVLIDDTDGRVVVHLLQPIDSTAEARMLNVLSHLCPSYRLDPIVGPDRPVKALPDGWWDEFVARHPRFASAA